MPCQLPWVMVSAATKLATAEGMKTIIVVESVATAFPEPPPDTLTWLTCGELALEATFTFTVIAGKLAPAFRASLRVQLLAVQVQPVPAMDTSVSPAGGASVTVTAPLVGNAFAAFETVTEYAALFCPCVKFPVCVFVTLSNA